MFTISGQQSEDNKIQIDLQKMVQIKRKETKSI